MGVASLPQSVNYPQGQIEPPMKAHHDHDKEWMGAAVGGTLLLGSVLLLSGKRRAGLVLTAAGTALALLEEQETVRAWWNALPAYLDNAQRLLEEAQKTIDDLSSKRDKLRSLFGR
jgi:hypothetical protein